MLFSPGARGQANGGASLPVLPVLPNVPNLVQLGAAATRGAIDSAKTLVKANNVAAAEAALTKLSAFQPNTVDWHLETTQKLMSVAQEMSREGGNSAASVSALTTQSLQHLAQIGTLSSDNKVKAGAQAMSGFIQQRYVGDPVAALTSYRAALALSPNDSSLKETVDRLATADAILRARIKPAAKK